MGLLYGCTERHASGFISNHQIFAAEHDIFFSPEVTFAFFLSELQSLSRQPPIKKHQIEKQLSHPYLHRHHIQGGVLQSIAKAIHQSPSPIYFHKVKSHTGIIGNEYADALLENQSQPTLTLQIFPLKQLALR